MNLVKITNKTALVTVILMIYWVFIFISSTVFGFKVFQQNMTEIFLLSILGIFSILLGAIILNIMFNLTAIAEARKPVAESISKSSKPLFGGFVISLVVIFALLYIGDWATSRKKERYLVSAVSDLVEEKKHIIDRLADYEFSRDYIENAAQDIKVLSKIEEKFPRITVIVRDQLEGKPLLLRFTHYTGLGNKKQAQKADYILSTSSEERRYLNRIFDGELKQHRFSANDGRYEIYYPLTTDKGQIVLHLSQYSRYGKIGS